LPKSLPQRALTSGEPSAHPFLPSSPVRITVSDYVAQ
jgi:hypothetical protein